MKIKKLVSGLKGFIKYINFLNLTVAVHINFIFDILRRHTNMKLFMS